MNARRPAPLALFAVCLLLSAGLFAASIRFDNKYAHRGVHPAKAGVMRLNSAVYAENPLLFLVDGWEFYHNKLLGPDDFSNQSPDAFVFIGQYGGFELGDPHADPHGSATYRLTVFVGDAPQDFALEIPEIYSSCRVWVNGEMKYSRGNVEPGEYRPATGNAFVAFTARDKVEIVVQATDHTNYYSGMVYPPAFGDPAAVHRMLSLRLLVHGAACAAALFIGVFCLLLGWRRPGFRNWRMLSLLCGCFIGMASYPAVRLFGLSSNLSYVAEMVCHYGFFLAAIWLEGRLCGIPEKIWRPAAGVAAAVCLAAAVFPHAGASALPLYAFSLFLGAYKRVAAVYLIAAAFWAVWRGKPGSRGVLAGSCVIGSALVADRAAPLFEPILFGWHTETAGFVFLLIITGILLSETLRVYRESSALREQHAVDAARLEAHLVQSRLEKDHLERTRRFVHETRNHYALMRLYLQKSDNEQLAEYLDSLLDESAGVRLVTYCENEIVNAILSAKLGSAREQGIRVKTAAAGVPAQLVFEDADLAGLFMNMLDNALEACLRLPDGYDRWISLQLHFVAGVLAVECENSCAEIRVFSGGRPATTKPDAANHGEGLRVMEEIARKYDGFFEVSWDEKSFHLRAGLNTNSR